MSTVRWTQAIKATRENPTKSSRRKLCMRIRVKKEGTLQAGRLQCKRRCHTRKSVRHRKTTVCLWGKIKRNTRSKGYVYHPIAFSYLFKALFLRISYCFYQLTHPIYESVLLDDRFMNENKIWFSKFHYAWHLIFSTGGTSNRPFYSTCYYFSASFLL